MIDVREYPGVLDALNQIINSGKEASIKVEYNGISVAEHRRFFHGLFASGEEEPRRKFPGNNDMR